ncbi:MAG: electron transporter [Gammaproteobacteria bacterium RBG_16_51_14]|nr:MAG: electron transporter [Gammaproteobacteria bacterium RBG_16_51_14]
MNSAALLTFPKGGVHPPESKELTSGIPIEEMPVPANLEIILGQHIGVPCEPLVKKHSKVQEGELIGQVSRGLGVPIHAPISGTVANIGDSYHPFRVSTPSVTIRSSTDSEPVCYTPVDWNAFSREELKDKVRAAGIIGAGGAGFPTHVKLSPPPDARIDTLILNGAECEPYLTADHRIMVEHAEEVIIGAQVILKILGIKRCLIGIEANKPDAIATMTDAARKQSRDAANRGEQVEIAVKTLQVKYPQGSEKQLIQSLTGRKVPGFGLPLAIGVVVQNITTARAIYEAAVLNKPFIEKVVTISGRGIKRPANLNVKVGTLVSDIVNYLGGTTEDLKKVVLGGPMMGFAVSTLDIPILKTTSSILFLTKDEIDIRPHSNCIRCGWCVEVCPMGLQPCEIGMYVEAGKGKDTRQFGALECFECGSCAYVCPAKRPLVQFVRLAKMELNKKPLVV